MNESVKKLLKANMWDLATCANGEPNVVPVAFKDVTSDGKLVVGDVFLDTTLKNLAADGGKIAISIYDAKSLEGYQIKGTAEYVTEGDTVKTFKTMVEQMFNGGATASSPRKRSLLPLPVRATRKSCNPALRARMLLPCPIFILINFIVTSVLRRNLLN